jgi:threonyl-tRNA synthetase
MPLATFSRQFSVSGQGGEKVIHRKGGHFREHAVNMEETKNRTDYLLSMSPWTKEEVDSVKILHEDPERMTDHLAYGAVQLARWSFDKLSGYSHGPISTGTIINRCLFLETVAGIPGCVGGTLRHLRSLRRMERDMGWIHSLIEEAENERMHLLTFLKLRQPGPLFRIGVQCTQVLMWNFFFFMYLISPRTAHKFVAYLEEEAVITYTSILERMDRGENQDLVNMKIPDVAKAYWKMSDDATMRDLILQIRADEAHHRHANHTFASIKPTDANPFNHGFPKLSEIQQPGAFKQNS